MKKGEEYKQPLASRVNRKSGKRAKRAPLPILHQRKGLLNAALDCWVLKQGFGQTAITRFSSFGWGKRKKAA